MPRSAEQVSMTLQSLDQTWGWIGSPTNGGKEGVAIGACQDHALMLVEQPAGRFIRQIAGGKTADRHGLLDDLLGRWREAQFDPLRFVFAFWRC
jgi:hypothetical protein